MRGMLRIDCHLVGERFSVYYQVVMAFVWDL
jgi:hypothetical protein